MYKTVKSYVDEHQMFDGATGVVAGVSGGADSVCLLLTLAKMSRCEGFFLGVVHVEHGIRGSESLADADFTEELCEKLGVPFVKFSVDAVSASEKTGQSLEEAARILRYGCFNTACKDWGADRMAVAHNADDNAETMLFNLSRGSGIRGLCGIRPVSPLPVFSPDGKIVNASAGEEPPIKLIRPLLSVTGGEIREWLKSMGQPWREDATNADIAYARNRLRLNVMPELRQINARAVNHLSSMSDQLTEICDFLDEAAYDAGRDAFSLTEDGDGKRSVEIYCDRLAAMPEVLKKHLLIDLIGETAGGRKDITSGHVAQVLDLGHGEPGRSMMLPRGLVAERKRDSVVISHGGGAQAETARPHFEVELAIPGTTVTPEGLVFTAKILDFDHVLEKIPKKRYTKWFDYDKMKNAVLLRGRRPGDFLQTTAEGGHKKLKDYFTDEKIDPSEREDVYLLADGSHVMWAVGYRISEAYKVTADTARVLEVEVCKGKGESGYGGENRCDVQ